MSARDTIDDSAHAGTESLKSLKGKGEVADPEHVDPKAYVASPSFRQDIGAGEQRGARAGGGGRAAARARPIQRAQRATCRSSSPHSLTPPHPLTPHPPPPLPGKWYHAGYHLATTIATPAAYAFLPFAFAALGWGPGLLFLLLGVFITWYASILLASLSGWNGVRYVRYRDLARSIGGPWASASVVLFQQIASLGNNITLGSE